MLFGLDMGGNLRVRKISHAQAFVNCLPPPSSPRNVCFIYAIKKQLKFRNLLGIHTFIPLGCVLSSFLPSSYGEVCLVKWADILALYLLLEDVKCNCSKKDKPIQCSIFYLDIESSSYLSSLFQARMLGTRGGCRMGECGGGLEQTN